MGSTITALEVDLTGQVCADSIGTTIYSGFGGQLDFIRGAAHEHPAASRSSPCPQALVESNSLASFPFSNPERAW